MSNKICFIILSHSSYTDIWELLIKSYKEKLTDNIKNIDFYITSDSDVSRKDKALLNENHFNLLLYKKDISWSDALIEIVSKNELNNYNQMLFSFDDLIITKFSEIKFEQAINEMVSNNYKYLKIYNSSHVNIWGKLFNLIKKDPLYEISKLDSYRGNLVFSCWNTTFFKNILNNKELTNLSPWQFEQQINKFIDNDNGYKCVFSNVLEYENVIIKGKVHEKALRKSENITQVNYDMNNREFMSNKETLIYTMKLYIFKVFRQIIPHRLFLF
ncbi:hypothetical protein [Polaribacter ponticola]|uniref:Glycosyltransferase family 2 protein n=1 Tax=Polaribacter ponticola TaxID=2978475 RepID=A0ABT5S5L6_9FLAO|nr:hypothetical protein [Polaribacter sp. MSW5]MDD7913389.1 hypothetical protein [Polaribacter sp. MSW5]